ncbi:hypothetical protein Phep_2152 [Pedobacter heparinus DSM 2366]|uniref:Uncharacterized protein n=1 Tax=Pedobacter heparinus (strain ATCC 13125 / DSM 2366 / CIP 104194 / JCM 7457 / NBRC 12017 / NCIMB 9290 / NRRL B-14731 / HIM 762-3) TaxID=485917 RepID=C6XXT8_PEDHD|nr:hypothetical protein Phep_2152 [Pedobacter heparinus DSM 2366]
MKVCYDNGGDKYRDKMGDKTLITTLKCYISTNN